MARKNGSGNIEALLERIVQELVGVKQELAGFRADSNARMDRTDAKIERLDARLDLMAFSYRDLRERVTDIEKKP